MKGKHFATIEQLQEKSKQKLLVIPQRAFQKCSEDWRKRWHKCIISASGHFEGDKIVVDKKNKEFLEKFKITVIF